MKLNGRRESNNVDDRRGMRGSTAAGLGIGSVVLIALFTFLQGGNLGDVITNVGTQMAQSQVPSIALATNASTSTCRSLLK